ncbi:MAG: UDP-3-O-(3-hydroxymyristoyl)glucosamine N-acyltransferase [Candidatus Kapabacteria bacterium]|nr:UDP-3-O-(3-hydroxymyristoyl)glucosamine N-acyltransferase [Candidatus Kapabacteria bacterium]
MKITDIPNIENIAKICNGFIKGNINLEIKNLNRIEYSVPGDLTFISSPNYLKYFFKSQADGFILNQETYDSIINSDQSGKYTEKCFIICADPYKSFILLLQYINSNIPILSSFIHPSAIIGQNTNISSSAFIGPNVVIGDNCSIADKSIIEANCVIGNDCIIGSGTHIFPLVSLYYDTIIGTDTIIHSGAVIGADGFSNIENSDGSYQKIPQLGNVIIGNNVEIGANTCIDRSLIGSTLIEDGVKLDNLIHIAHSCLIGENSAFAAQVGVAGSVKIGKRNRLGGQVGLAGHLDTADDVIIMAQSGVAKSVENKGIYFGSPIKDRMRAFKIEAVIRQLPELFNDIKDLKNKILNS